MREEFVKSYCNILGWSYFDYDYTLRRLCEEGHFTGGGPDPLIMIATGWFWAVSDYEEAEREAQILELELNQTLETYKSEFGVV